MEVSKRSKKLLAREALALQHSVCDAICGAASDVQKSFAVTLEVVDKSFNLIRGHLKRGDLVKLGSSSPHFGNFEPQKGRSKVAFDRESVLMSDTSQSSAYVSCVAGDSRDCPVQFKQNIL